MRRKIIAMGLGALLCIASPLNLMADVVTQEEEAVEYEMPEQADMEELYQGTAVEPVNALIDVQYGQSEAREMLQYVNDFRTGEDAWYWRGDNTTKYFCENLSPLTYDYELERIAMQRAAEIALSLSHTRPNGGTCWTAFEGYSWFSIAENIAAGSETAWDAFVQWQENDEPYSGQLHRRTMLGSSQRIGIGHVIYEGYHYWVQEFSTSTMPIQETEAYDGSMRVTVPISQFAIRSVTPLTESYTLMRGETRDVPAVSGTATFDSGWPVTSRTLTLVCDWSISEHAGVTVSDGQITANEEGRGELTASVAGMAMTVPVASHEGKYLVDDKEASCSEEGYTGDEICTTCGEVLSTGEKIEKIAHTVEVDPGVEATCTEAGVTEGSHCTVCNEVLTAQEVVPAMGHTPVVDPEVAATCTETGLTEGSHCTVCNEVLTAQEEVPATGHTYISEVTDPTYTAKGYTTHTCSVCGDSYRDSETAVLKKTPPTVKVANAASGIQISWTKTEGANGYYVYRRTAGTSYERIASVTGGSTVKYIDKTAKAGTKYIYTVRAYNEAGPSTYKPGRSMIRLTNPTVTLSKPSTGVKVSWKKVTGAKGYYVYRKTGSGSYKRIETIKGTSTLSYTDKTAKKGTTYTYTVRAYNGSYLSAYTGKTIKR